MTKFFTFLGILTFGVAAMVAVSAFEALPVKWLWNGTVVPLFKAPRVTFCQAWALLALCGMLFRSVGTFNAK